MSKKKRSRAEQPPASAPCQLYLILEIAPGSSLLEQAPGLFGAVQIASVLIRPQNEAHAHLAPADLEAFLALAQSAGTAVLLADDIHKALELGTDGLHLSHADDVADRFARAREILPPGAIIGVDAGRTRHTAMTVAEAGADYVAFGIPAAIKDREKAIERQRELIAWWAEIFEPPCIGIDVATLDDAIALAQSGADFVAMTPPDGLTTVDLIAWVRDTQATLASASPKPEDESASSS